MDSTRLMQRRQLREYVRRQQEQLQEESRVYCDWDAHMQIAKYVLLMCYGSLLVALLVYFFDDNLWVQQNPWYQIDELVMMFPFLFLGFGVHSILLEIIEFEEKRASRGRQSFASSSSIHIATPQQRPPSSNPLFVLPQEQRGETTFLRLPAERTSECVFRPRGLFRSSFLPEEHMQVSPLETRFDHEILNPAFLAQDQDILGPSRIPQTLSSSRANGRPRKRRRLLS